MFSEFYLNGGIFMHVITMCALVALTAIFLHGRARRAGREETRLLSLAERMATLGLAVGLLGSLFACVDMAVALSSVDVDNLMLPALRGAALVPITFTWGLMCAIPLWAAATVLRTLGPDGRQAPAS